MKKFKHLIGLAEVVLLAVVVSLLGAPALGIGLVGCYQLMQFAQSKSPGCCFTTVLTPEQLKEFEGILGGLKGYDAMFKELHEIAKQEGGWNAIKSLPALLKGEQKRNDELQAEIKKVFDPKLLLNPGKKILLP